MKPYDVTPHLNCLVEMVQMRGHNIRFYTKLIKSIPNYHQIPLLIYSSGYYRTVLRIQFAELKVKMGDDYIYFEKFLFVHLYFMF